MYRRNSQNQDFFIPVLRIQIGLRQWSGAVLSIDDTGRWETCTPYCENYRSAIVSFGEKSKTGAKFAPYSGRLAIALLSASVGCKFRRKNQCNFWLSCRRLQQRALYFNAHRCDKRVCHAAQHYTCKCLFRLIRVVWWSLGGSRPKP